jgi:NAD-dependent SIR2 family protein deacetylase
MPVVGARPSVSKITCFLRARVTVMSWYAASREEKISVPPPDWIRAMSLAMRERLRAGCIFTNRDGCESKAMTSMRSLLARMSTVALAAAFAISRGNPIIDPDRSMTSAIASEGVSRRCSVSMRTGKMRSMVVLYQPPSP